MAILDHDLQGGHAWVLLTEAPRLREPGWCQEDGTIYLRCKSCNNILSSKGFEKTYHNLSMSCLVCGKCGTHVFYYFARQARGVVCSQWAASGESHCCREVIYRFGTAKYCSKCWSIVGFV